MLNKVSKFIYCDEVYWRWNDAWTDVDFELKKIFYIYSVFFEKLVTVDLILNFFGAIPFSHWELRLF